MQGQRSFCRQSDVLLSGQSGHAQSGTGADRAADERALAAGGERTDQGASRAATADEGDVALLNGCRSRE
jgi:hypothetical protein